MNVNGPVVPVRVAMVGVGAWARVLANAAQSSRKIQIASCLGRSPEHVAEFVKSTGIPVAASYEEILSDQEINGVILALPNEIHLEFARKAAQAGKHVYLEKPIANTLEDALQIAQLETMYGVSVVVGHCSRFLTGIRLIRKMIDDGLLGNVNLIETNFSNDRGLRLTAKDWRWYNNHSPGGCLSQIAIHQFDALRYLGGDLLSINAISERRSPAGAEVEDQWIVIARFSDGKLGSVVSSWTSPGVYSVRVLGDRAYAYYEIDQTYWSMPENLHREAQLYVCYRGEGILSRHLVTVPPGNMFRDELELFATGIMSGQQTEISASNGLLALAAVHAALASASNGGGVKLISEIVSEARGSMANASFY